MIVVDTNVIVAAMIEQQFTLDDIIRERSVLVPITFELELINVLRKYYYLRKIDINAIHEFHVNALSIIDQFIPIEIIKTEAMNISFDINHPIYDCLFLAVAKLNELPFVSLDKQLIAKAQKMGIKTIQF